MASKQRNKIVEVTGSLSNIITRRAKYQRLEINNEKKKKNIQVIEKPKLNTDKKPQINKAIRTSKQKKVHKCSICSKEFKGVYY